MPGIANLKLNILTAGAIFTLIFQNFWSVMMVKQSLIPLELPVEWKAALQGIKHSVAYTWEYCCAMYLTSHLPTFLYCFETGDTRIVCPMLEREFHGYKDLVKPFGYSGFIGTGDCSGFPSYWKEYAQQREYVCGYLGINPLFENTTYFNADEIGQYNNIYVIDLTLSHEALWANLSHGRQDYLKNWKKISADLVLEKSILKKFLITHYNDFIQSKNGPGYYKLSDATLNYMADLDNVHMVGAQISGKLVAVVLTAYTADGGEALFSASLPEGKNFSTAIYWQIINHLKSIGIPHINFGGSIYEDDGLARFKQQFGSWKLPLKSLRQVYHSGIYEKLCRQVGVDIKDGADYFPAYRNPKAANKILISQPSAVRKASLPVNQICV